MNSTLIIILIGAGLIVVVGGILIFTGKGGWLKKIILPLLALVGIGVAADKVLGKGSKEIREERDRIEGARKDIEQQHKDTAAEHAEKTAEHTKTVDDLEGQIKESDAKAASQKAEIEAMEKGGAKEHFDNLSPDEQAKILDEAKLSTLPSEFRKGDQAEGQTGQGE